MTDAIRLLIVDDEEDFLETVKMRLESRGFAVATATNGEEAVDLAGREPFDLALVDMQMPGIDGQELLARLKAQHSYIEVIMLTGHGSIQSAVECGKLGAFDYLTKPYELDELILKLKDAYEHRLRRKFERDEERLEQLMKSAIGESPLSILRRFRKMDSADE